MHAEAQTLASAAEQAQAFEDEVLKDLQDLQADGLKVTWPWSAAEGTMCQHQAQGRAKR